MSLEWNPVVLLVDAGMIVCCFTCFFPSLNRTVCFITITVKKCQWDHERIRYQSRSHERKNLSGRDSHCFMGTLLRYETSYKVVTPLFSRFSERLCNNLYLSNLRMLQKILYNSTSSPSFLLYLVRLLLTL